MLTIKFNKDYPLSGNVEGDEISFKHAKRIPHHLRDFADVVDGDEEPEGGQETGDPEAKKKKTKPKK